MQHTTQLVRSYGLCFHYENYLFYCCTQDVAFHGNGDWAVNPLMMGGTVQQRRGLERLREEGVGVGVGGSRGMEQLEE